MSSAAQEAIEIPAQVGPSPPMDDPGGDDAHWSASGRLKVQQSIDSRGIAVALEGEFDLETASELDRRLAEIEQAAGAPGRLLIDLRAVRFLDCAGLAAIIRAREWAETRHCELVLRRGPRQAQRLLQIAGIEPRLTFCDE